MPNKKDYIYVKGAREHNLKNIDIKIPRDSLTVITGLSGSGKSSLAFDTIYAEGQRRYVESLSAYARQFLGLMNKPDIDSIDGLSPAISIEQKTTSKNPRSTVGTVTEIYDYLRLLYARVGHPHCPVCGDEIKAQTIDEIVSKVIKHKIGTKIQILSPIIRQRKGEYNKLVEEYRKKGFTKIRIDGKVQDTDEDFRLDKQIKHNLELIVDRVVMDEKIKSRLTEAIETALKEADGLLIIDADGKEKIYSQKFACPKCDINLPEFTPRMFSFNSPFGACPVCQGLGTKLEIDPELVIPDRTKTIRGGAIAPWGYQFKSFYMTRLASVANHYGFDMDTPIENLKDKHINIILYGSSGEKIKTVYEHKHSEGHWETKTDFEGVINNLKRLYSQTTSEHRKKDIHKYMREDFCTDCNGKRLKKEVLAVTVDKKSIIDITDMSIQQCLDFFNNITLTKTDAMIAKLILKEVKDRLQFLCNVGLDYLNLSRASGTLSGGESQRIRLATQIGSNLVGVMYILDEPSIGLHQRDNIRLIDTLKRLRDLGNTLIVVEHDQEMMESADHIIDMGPGAGTHGGTIVAEGTYKDIINNKNSNTGLYLSGKKKIDIPEMRRQKNEKSLKIIGASENNLKNIDIEIPLNILTCVTGVSGSGKSTLINSILYNALMRHVYNSTTHPGKHKTIEGLEHIDKIIAIDQSPIGRTPRSNPATYTKLFGDIRDIFAMTKDAKKRGYKAGRFSFNVAQGRCSACDGDGVIKIEMHFLPDIYVPCEVCNGKRYSSETLEIKYKDKTIADVLDMTVEEALTFFDKIPRIKKKLETLNNVGLGYIKLGQSSTTLSGGEAQRIKLSSELSKRGTGKTVYILDEPTTGLHFDDINKLLLVLNRLVDQKNTVIVIEHNLDVIKTADHIIDLGLEGGDKGGNIIAEGTPEAVAEIKESYTGQFLKKVL
ncbi:MAG: excinuclease ABC subunit UvrA [DPANN group archaeon]|nr:excinuclease ABC subunit UvrA [DPANN group archaeon]